MPELIQAYWPYMLIALAIGIAVAWFVFVATRKTSVVSERKDVLDEGAERAKRNTALIDAPPAAAGELSRAANSQAVAHASAEADAEAGAHVAASTPATEPVAAPELPSAATTAAGDDLTRIKGLGPKIAALLQTLGVTNYAQIAAWDDAEIDRIDAQLDRFQGRIRRDNWVEQAKLLAAGDESGFAGRFGQNG